MFVGKIKFRTIFCRDQNKKPRQFTSELAKGYDIAASDFTQTITWVQLKSPSRYDTLWVGTLPVEVKEKIAFYFPETINSIKISNIIGYKEKWNNMWRPDGEEVWTTEVPLPPVEPTECTGIKCLEHQECFFTRIFENFLQQLVNIFAFFKTVVVINDWISKMPFL